MQRHNSPLLMQQLLSLMGLGMLVTLVGCTDGVFHKMKSINPYYRSQWAKDRQLATTFSERVEEITLLKYQLPSMDSSAQANWADVLFRLIQSDPSPEMRALACQTIVLIPGETTVRALNTASIDQSEKVRLMACAGWQQTSGVDAKNMLITMASNTKETPSVRRAAVNALANFNDDEVKQALARLLDDKSPVLQFATTRSLKTLTGRDYGGDVQAWRDFMSGNDVPEPERSFVAGLWDTMTFER